MMGIHATFNFTMAQVAIYPEEAYRGAFYTVGGEMISRLSLPTDPVGTLYLTLSNIVPGSVVSIESVSGISFYTGTISTSTTQVILQVYAAGSPLNDIRVKVRKGSSSPFYQAWETITTAIAGSQSIYVSQIPDE